MNPNPTDANVNSTSITVEEVRDLVMNGQVAKLANVMERFQLKKGTPPHLDENSLHLVRVALTAAAAAANCGKLSDKMAGELLERTAATVDVFDFSVLVVAAADYSGSANDLPLALSIQLQLCSYNHQIGERVESLSKSALLALLNMFATNSIGQADSRITLHIVRRIYGLGFLPKPVLFAFMALSLREPAPIPAVAMALASDPMSRMLAGILSGIMNGETSPDDDRPSDNGLLDFLSKDGGSDGSDHENCTADECEGCPWKVRGCPGDLRQTV